MKIDRLLVFDVWGEYAHFRRGYTTTSALTYHFPPKSALIGLIAGILGLPNEKWSKQDTYYHLLYPNNLKLSIRILRPVKKIVIKENFIDTKHGFTHWEIQRKKQPPRTQIPLEFIKNPHYRIYVWIGNHYFEKLREFLENHESIYTPYLGITECIANLKFVNSFEEKEIDSIRQRNETYEIDSVIPVPAISGKIIMEKNISYGRENLPLFINEKREAKSYCEFVFNMEGNDVNNRRPIKIEGIADKYKNFCISIANENVILF